MTDRRQEAWLAERRTAVTASDVGPILGVGYRTAMDVYLSKKGLAQDETTERMRWGLKLQRAILEEYAERTGVPVEFADPYMLHRHPDFPHLGATLDARRADGDRRPVDAKNVGFKTPDWGPAGSDKIPHQYALQLHVQMMVTGTDAADLAVLFGGNRFETFTVLRDPEVDHAILTAARSFWEDHIQKSLPPPVDGSAGWTDFLGRFVPMRTSQIKAASPDDEVAIRHLLSARQALVEIQANHDLWENTLKASIGEARGLESDRARILWTQSKGSSKVNWEAVAAELSKYVPGDAATILAEVVARHTTTAPGTRRFTVTDKGVA